MENLKKVLKVIGKIILVLVILVVISGIGVFGAVSFIRWQADQNETIDEEGNIIISPDVKKEDNVTCLFMGVNGALTDFIMLGQYNPNTREIDLLSIPRDTRIPGSGAYGKINSAYAGKYPDRTISRVEEITGIKAEYYVVFDTKILRNIVDEIGGVTVNVPINMNYDDPYQNLYIHLKKGTQTLTGKQAEQFCRFRKNNDGTGYGNGDIGRIAAQQEFIKAVISKVLEAQNLLKINKLANIVLDGTKTNITWDIAKNYIDDVAKFKSDRIRIETLPGAGGYENNVSYYFHDKEATKELIQDMFLSDTSKESTTVENEVKETSSVIETDVSEKIRVEVLNAGVTSKVLTEVINNLSNAGYYVVKTGNYTNASSTENSRVIDYNKKLEDLVNIKEVVGIAKEELSNETSTVDFTVVLGPKYEL